ncbi:hypothetical protein GCM10022252_75000 [Streptosporangium oxazolinicum]|uniref:Sensor histidine kinase n=1 Tax=Streptosporangium oxazolinicum TaxID=909287 RepID=A0ABP8BKI9_9ACTN
MHRLEREADRARRWRQGAIYVQLSGAFTSVMTWFNTHEVRLVWAALGALAGAAVSWWAARRWAARTRWYAATPDWAERIDEAPTVRLFPALDEWFNAQTRTWGGVARIVAVPFVLLVLVLIFGDTIPTIYQP